MDGAFSVVSEKASPSPGLSSFSPVSSSSILVFYFTFRGVTHLGFISVKGGWSAAGFIFLRGGGAVLWLQPRLSKTLSLLPCVAFAPWPEVSDSICEGLGLLSDVCSP